MVEKNGEDSFISGEMTICGQLKCQGNLVIAGRVEGELQAKEVRLLAGGEFRGELVCERLCCSGRLEGSAAVDHGVFSQTARHYGQLKAKTLELESGVRYGHLQPLFVVDG